MNLDEQYMQRCLYLAKQGVGQVSPNPLVGSVVVYQGKIIGEGYHKKCGEAHAEVNAIASVKDQSLLKEATLYVNLEPCSHFGKTPPCSNLIVKKGIKRVVIGMKDPNPLVAGKSIERLKANGINVTSGVLEKQAIELNRRFITFITQHRPYVILKWAETKDGFIDVLRPMDENQPPRWITNKFCKQLVHKWRSEEDAFMIGKHTAIKDNPQLTVREWSGRNPKRIITDYDNNLPHDLSVFDKSAESIVLNGVENKTIENIKHLKISSRTENISEILHLLYEENVQSLVVEGGSELFKHFINKALWDEARIFTGNHYFRSGIKAPDVKGVELSKHKFGNSTLQIIRKKI